MTEEVVGVMVAAGDGSYETALVAMAGSLVPVENHLDSGCTIHATNKLKDL